MRLTTCLAVLFVATFPLPALAQGGLGLDLSDEKKKEEPATETPTEAQAPAEKLADLEAAAPQGPRAKPVEVDVASEDRVKSVQRRVFLKYHRFELTPMGFVTLNDPYFPKIGPEVRGSFYLNESFGVGVRVGQYNLVPTDNEKLAKRQLESKLPKVLPETSASLDLLWSPIYGKVSLFNSIKQFELYLVGGVGAVFSQTSSTDGAHLSSHIGLGQRFSITDWLTFDLSVLETLWSDRPDAGSKSVTQNSLSIQGGFGFFLPFSSNYREP